MTERRDFDHLDDSSLYNYCWDGGSEWTSMISEQISQPDNEVELKVLKLPGVIRKKLANLNYLLYAFDRYERGKRSRCR